MGRRQPPHEAAESRQIKVQAGQQFPESVGFEPRTDGPQREESRELSPAVLGILQLAGDTLGPERRLKSQGFERLAGSSLHGLSKRLGQLAFPIGRQEVQQAGTVGRRR